MHYFHTSIKSLHTFKQHKIAGSRMLQKAVIMTRSRSTSSSSSSSSSNNSRHDNFTINIPSQATSKSWERGAKLVKSNTTTDNQYLEHIREEHDPSLQLKTIEDELRGTMGRALGKQGEKIINSLNSMQQEKEKYNEILFSSLKHDNDDGLPSDKKVEDIDKFNALSLSLQKEVCIITTRYNDCRDQALKSRWELLVHRAAVGFVVNNTKFVEGKFPIPDRLCSYGDVDEHDLNISDQTNVTKSEVGVTRTFTDQRDWWDLVGRWK